MDRLGIDFTAATADRMCLTKKQFLTKNQARDHALRGQKQFGNDVTVPYKCSICLKFHLTSLTREAGNAAKRRAWKAKPIPTKTTKEKTRV